MTNCQRCNAEILLSICASCVCSEVEGASVDAVRNALDRAAELCEEHAAMYPPDVFVGEVGIALRWKCLLLAKKIRGMSQ